MKIVFNPSYSKTNEYSNIIVSYLVQNSIDVYSLDEIFKSLRKFKSVKIVHLNWFETVGTLTSFILKIVKLTILIIFRKKIIWTMHNKTPHIKKIVYIQKILQFLLVKSAYKIVIHSKISEDILTENYNLSKGKIIYIPHPNYINVYGNIPKNSDKQSSKLRLLFLGALRPYKNIELLMDVVDNFKKEIELHVAGNPVNEKYKKELTNHSKNKGNISLEMKFIDDKRMISLLSDYDLVILPYDIRSSLNSGTIILCFSYAKTVIAPEIGTIRDIKDKNYLITYNYENRKEHYKTLIKLLNSAIRAKHEDPEIFKEWGERMFDYVYINNSSEKVQQKFKMLYENIL